RPANTVEYRTLLSEFMAANAVRSVTDLGCGDWQFSHLVDWSRVQYLGVDVVPEIVARNRARFAAPNIRFEEFDSIDDLSGGDLVLLKEVLQHLPNRVIIEYLAAIRTKYRFALLTNGVEPAERANLDIATGDWRPLRLQDAPFNAPGAVVLRYAVRSETAYFSN